jgi:hypothetical protein
LPAAFRFARMFRPVEDQYLSRRAFCGDQIRVLRHVPGLVDFPGVNYLLNDLNLGCCGDGVTTQLSAFVVPFELNIAFREVDCCDLEVILGLV